MSTFYNIREFGERLRKSNIETLSLGEISKIVMHSMNVHSSKAIKHYLEVLESQGYIKSVLVDNCVRFEIIKRVR